VILFVGGDSRPPRQRARTYRSITPTSARPKWAEKD
jgi:hypothetical protein